MNNNKFLLPILIILLIFMTSCVPASGLSNDLIIQTAVAQTLSADLGLAAAEGLYASGTDDPLETPDPDSTLSPSETETTADESQDPVIEPTSPNPWMLQSWCEEHVGCVAYEVRNRTDSWLQIELRKTDTGAAGFFTVKSKTTGYITLVPGQYETIYTYWCDGEVHGQAAIKAVGNFRDYFKCPQGYYLTESK